MSPSKKISPFPMMTANIKLSKWVGLWQDERKLTRRSVVVISGVFVWFLLPSVLFIIRKADELILLLKPILELIALSIFDLRLIWYVGHRETLQQCYLELQEAFGEFTDNPHEDVRRTLKHLRVSADYFVKIYTFMVLFQASSYGLVKSLITIYRSAIGDESLVLKTVLEADFVFYDHLSSFWLWLPTAIVSLLLQYGLILNTTAEECLYWNLLHHVSCLFKIVRAEFSRLDTARESEQFKQKLATLVRIHEVGFRSARRMESVLNPVMGLLYCSCIFQMCYVAFVATVIDDLTIILSMVFVLQYTVFLIFAFSMLGAELTEESAAISKAIYTNIRWYERSVTERRLLLFVQMRSDRVASITAAKFIALNRATFANAMTTAYSYFTMMRQVLMDKS